MKTIKAIIFDFDNTLANRTLGAYLAYGAMLDCFFPELQNDLVYREAVLQDVMHWDLYGNYSKKFVVENLQKKYALHLPVDIEQWWIENLYRYEALFDDTIETLQYLKQKGYLLGILTNGSASSQRSKLEKTQVISYVDKTVVCGEHSFKKPERQAFDCICQQLQVEPYEAVYVGDIYSNDVIGAKKAGLMPIWICSDPYLINSDQVTRIYQISDLKKLF